MGNAIVTQRDTMLEKQRSGYIKLSLTNFTTSAEPTIAAGSVVEISGSLYSFTTNESITGWSSLSVGDAYIKLVPDGTNPCTAEFTATAPTWSDAKQGWYDATGTDRYVAGLYKTSATEYDNKYIYDSVLRGNNTWTGDNTFSGENEINVSQITGLTYGDIGTYIIAGSTDFAVNTGYAPGTVFDGSNFIRNDHTSGGFSSLNVDPLFGVSTFGVLLSVAVSCNVVGSWVLLTGVRRDSSTASPVGLFLRIS